LPWCTAAQIGAFIASIAVTGSARYENLRNFDEHFTEMGRSLTAFRAERDKPPIAQISQI
jgi:hypothetical protein